MFQTSFDNLIAIGEINQWTPRRDKESSSIRPSREALLSPSSQQILYEDASFNIIILNDNILC